jgi:hypothetical protein
MLCLCFYVFFNWPDDSKHLGSAGQQADEYIAPGDKFFIAPAERLYPQKKNCGKCQSGIINHPNGQNAVLITYYTGDWLAKFGFVPACIDNCILSYHGSAQQLCTQGGNDILVRGGCRPC